MLNTLVEQVCFDLTYASYSEIISKVSVDHQIRCLMLCMV